MWKRSCIGCHAANRATGLLKHDPRVSPRVRLESVNEIIDQFRCEGTRKAGLQISALGARIVDVAGFLQGNIIDGFDILPDYRSGFF